MKFKYHLAGGLAVIGLAYAGIESLITRRDISYNHTRVSETIPFIGDSLMGIPNTGSTYIRFADGTSTNFQSAMTRDEICEVLLKNPEHAQLIKNARTGEYFVPEYKE